jgi:hypothetical protein
MATALFRIKPTEGKRLDFSQASGMLGDKASAPCDLQEQFRHSALLQGSFEMARIQSSQDMDDIMRRFQAVIGIEGDASHKTAPRASEAALSSLPHARVLRPHKKQFAHDDSTCGVCCGRLIDGAALVRLPCGHLFHIHCSTSWLSKTCTCPECRYELETDDVLYEKTRIARMKDRKTVSCSCHPSGMHNCFFANPNKSLTEQLSDSEVKKDLDESGKDPSTSDSSSCDCSEPAETDRYFF